MSGANPSEERTLREREARLRQTAKMLRPLIGEDIDFWMELAPNLGSVKVDTDKIVQVVLSSRTVGSSVRKNGFRGRAR